MADLNIAARVFRDDVSQSLSAADLDYTTSFNSDWELHWVSVQRVGTGGNDDFDVTLDSAAGSNFDIIIAEETLANNQDAFITFDPPLLLQAGDEINVFFPSQGGSGRNMYVTILGKQA